MAYSRRILSAIIAFALWSPVRCDYTWPNPATDELESLLYEADSPFGSVFAGFVRNCNGVGADEGRITGAEWLRVAYHDMATADVEGGSGGIDASIFYEDNRAENVGQAFNVTRQQLRAFHSPRTSLSDLVALAAVVSLGACSNGKIIVPFRAGRIDAAAAGPSGVPEPQEDLETHTQSFKRQGFNQEEMIALVACGHSIGGVHGKDFPTIVEKPSNISDDSPVPFDNSPKSFDQFIATEFVANGTQNPLAFGFNETTRSDARIFNADGGNMISKLASSPDYFFKTCTALMERMINTVPHLVTLTDAIQMVPVKPKGLSIQVSGDTMAVYGSIRILDTLLYGRNSKVSINFKPRDKATSGPSSKVVPATTRPNEVGWGLYPGLVTNHTFYSFSANIPVSSGVSSFNVEVKDPATGASTILDNGGHGFPLLDLVSPQKDDCNRMRQYVNGTIINTVSLRVAVWNAGQYSNVSAEIMLAKDERVNTWDYVTVPMKPSTEIATDNYTIYEVAYTTLKFPLTWFNVMAYGSETTVSSIGNEFPFLFQS